MSRRTKVTKPRISVRHKKGRTKRRAKSPAPTRSRVGRPIVLTRALMLAIVSSIEAGAYIETAAAVHGVSKSALYEWMRRGARLARDEGERSADELLFIEFSDTMARSLAGSEVALVAQIVAAGREHWQACAWLLERKWPEKYGRRDVIRVAAPNEPDSRDDFDPSLLSDDELEQLTAMLTRAIPAEAKAGAR